MRVSFETPHPRLKVAHLPYGVGKKLSNSWLFVGNDILDDYNDINYLLCDEHNL